MDSRPFQRAKYYHIFPLLDFALRIDRDPMGQQGILQLDNHNLY
jgi:hypothetical protein